MAILSEVLALLDKWPEWKRVREAPSRIDELERKIAALEATPKAVGGKTCPACGQPAMRRTMVEPDPSPFGRLGAKLETWTCAICGEQDKVSTAANR